MIPALLAIAAPMIEKMAIGGLQGQAKTQSPVEKLLQSMTDQLFGGAANAMFGMFQKK